ncbi:RICIN domain-containing protein [Sorangium sp. So ce834]|uniref:RICIN domain-containing protein n=1 Tax=Sorangium sp. So ce834 TaxID=3133321 RepID=UPI003F63171E
MREDLMMTRSNTRRPRRGPAATPGSAAAHHGRAARRWVAAVASLGLAACEKAPLDAVAPATTTTLTQDLVAYWPFDEGEGTVVTDRSGNRRHGELTGGTWVKDGRFGRALHFDEGEFMTVGDFPNATSSWTASAWVRVLTDQPPADDTLRTVISTENAGGWELSVDYDGEAPGMRFGFWKGPEISDDHAILCSCLELQRWTHAVGVVDGEALTMSLYVDGRLHSTVPIEKTISPGPTSLYVGRRPQEGRLLVGDVDDIAIYSRALAPAEVAELFQHAVPAEVEADISTGTNYTLVGVQSGLCVDVDAAVITADDVVLQLWACNGGTNQQFRFEAVDGGYYRIRNVHSDKCLDVRSASTADGAAIVQYTCHDNPNQQWSVTEAGGGAVRITSRLSGKVIDAYGSPPSNGTALVQRASNGGASQQFKLTPLEAGTGTSGAGP